jgi:hypothetical protein
MNGRWLLAATCLTMAWCELPAQRVIHVLVALCDNVNQGIVKVPAALGNGQDPERNLYWGAAYGVRTWFNRSKDWKRVQQQAKPRSPVLERVIWKHTTADVYVVADAYDGAFIEEATRDLLSYAGGHLASNITVNGRELRAGGGADLIAYCGHDGLMEFAPPPARPAANSDRREVIILACISKRFFASPLKSTGAVPLLWTTGLMAPEAYTLDAALRGWILGEEAARVRERAALAYAKWQKCSAAAAHRLLVSGW